MIWFQAVAGAVIVGLLAAGVAFTWWLSGTRSPRRRRAGSLTGGGRGRP